jgi:hypothetical protein
LADDDEARAGATALMRDTTTTADTREVVAEAALFATAPPSGAKCREEGGLALATLPRRAFV